MSSAEQPPALNPRQRRILLETGTDSIAHGLERGQPLRPDPVGYPQRLRETGASFVTLELGGHLRGCIGTLTARQPLILDVAQHAFEAAFEDPRFEPVNAAELTELELHISVLSPAQPLTVRNEQDLLSRLRPGTDGLVIEEGRHRATFLPAVWDQLNDPGVFLSQLKYKAGLPTDYWSDTIKVFRYTTESFAD